MASESGSTSESETESDDEVGSKARLYCENCAKIVRRIDHRLGQEAKARWKDTQGITHKGKLRFGLTQRSRRLQDYVRMSTQTIY